MLLVIRGSEAPQPSMLQLGLRPEVKQSLRTSFDQVIGPGHLAVLPTKLLQRLPRQERPRNRAKSAARQAGFLTWRPEDPATLRSQQG